MFSSQNVLTGKQAIHLQSMHTCTCIKHIHNTQIRSWSILVSDLPACYARFTFRPYYFACIPVLYPRRWFLDLAGDFECDVGNQLSAIVLALAF